MKDLLNRIGETFTEGKDKLSTEIVKYKNESFLEGLIASTIFISMADGHMTQEEKNKLFSYVQQAEELKVFSSDDVIAIFNKIMDYYSFDHGIGEAEALKLISKMKSKEEQAVFMIRVASVFVRGDGELKDAEKKALIALCAELDISPEKIAAQ